MILGRTLASCSRRNSFRILLTHLWRGLDDKNLVGHWDTMTGLCDLWCHRRWASLRGKSAPTSSAPCAARGPTWEQTSAPGDGQEDAWRWPEWCSVSSRPDTRRRWERPTGGSAWLPVLFNAEGTSDVGGGRGPAILFLGLQFCVSNFAITKWTAQTEKRV